MGSFSRVMAGQVLTFHELQLGPRPQAALFLMHRNAGSKETQDQRKLQKERGAEERKVLRDIT